jgi:hypothetical protein
MKSMDAVEEIKDHMPRDPKKRLPSPSMKNNPKIESAQAIDSLLLRLASHYIWWKSPEEAVQFPKRVMAQVMEMGSYEDMLELTQTVGTEVLKTVIKTAEAGWFSPESWHFWNYRLALCEIGKVPPIPRKEIPTF